MEAASVCLSAKCETATRLCSLSPRIAPRPGTLLLERRPLIASKSIMEARAPGNERLSRCSATQGRILSAPLARGVDAANSGG